MDSIEQVKASIRPKVEHGFHIVKNIFGMRKVRAQGLPTLIPFLHGLRGRAGIADNLGQTCPAERCVPADHRGGGV